MIVGTSYINTSPGISHVAAAPLAFPPL